MYGKNEMETRGESDQSCKTLDVYFEKYTSNCSQPRDSQIDYLLIDL